MKRIKIKYWACLALLIFCSWTRSYAKSIEVKSPNGILCVQIELGEQITYSVHDDKRAIVEEGKIGLDIDGKWLGRTPRLRKLRRGTIDEWSQRIVPLKNKEIHNHCNMLRMEMQGNYAVEFRVFDNGFAYRFITDLDREVKVRDEEFTFCLPDEHDMHLSFTNSFKTSYEQPYSHLKSDVYKPESPMSYLPILLTMDSIHVLISEADLKDYPCMFVRGDKKRGLRATFPKCPLVFEPESDRSVVITEEADYIAKTTGKRSFPWRLFVITNNDKDLLLNELVYCLSSPCELKDTDWIKPGQVSWEWWNGAMPYGPDVNFVSGYNLDTYKYYIDFAGKYGIEYILMDEGWAMNTMNPYTPNPKVNVQEIIRYGKEKGVGVILWLTWLTVENNFDLFKTFADWGVSGVKIDFMDRSDQWMVNFYERVVKEAAKYKLLIDFHGSFKPAGLEHRYPNLISYEGVRGMEQMGGCTPDNSLYLPFIRNSVGPMDYTPGAMLSMQPEVYAAERPNAASIGTRAYQMALYVVFESGVQMLADSPTQYYRNSECTKFITSVPTTWDETRVLSARTGEWVVIAKRKGEEWFIGAICNGKEPSRDFTFPLDFLQVSKSYRMTSFEDGVNADRQAMDYRKIERKVNSTDSITIHLARNGGWAALIR